MLSNMSFRLHVCTLRSSLCVCPFRVWLVSLPFLFLPLSISLAKYRPLHTLLVYCGSGCFHVVAALAFSSHGSAVRCGCGDGSPRPCKGKSQQKRKTIPWLSSGLCGGRARQCPALSGRCCLPVAVVLLASRLACCSLALVCCVLAAARRCLLLTASACCLVVAACCVWWWSSQ